MTRIAESSREALRQEPELNEADGSDLLTSLLEPCRFRSVVSRPWRRTAPWGIEAAQSPPGFVLVLEGSCVLDVGDENAARSLGARDLAIVTRTARLRLRDSQASATVQSVNLLQPDDTAERNSSAHGGSTTATRLLSGCFSRVDDYTKQMFDLLPPVVVLRGNSSEVDGWFRPLADLLLAETERALPGGELLSNRVLQILLIQALRQSAVELPDAVGGLLAALRVPGLGATMGAIHSRPEHDWSVHELADLAGLSRAAFAARFLETVGHPPFHYLRDVRMRLACRLLRESEKGIKEIAGRVGYSTEASFSKAFTRWCGQAPGEYRRQSRRAEISAARHERVD